MPDMFLQFHIIFHSFKYVLFNHVFLIIITTIIVCDKSAAMKCVLIYRDRRKIPHGIIIRYMRTQKRTRNLLQSSYK